MDVNFALTAPSDWAVAELSRRVNNIRNVNASPWATQRKPWVRAISSAIVNGSSDLRNKYVLFTGNQTTFANSYDPTYFRPTFGITSMEMDFKGTMGSTRSITLNFQCWTKLDLQNLEKLYMIPGMSIIVEWGWSLTADGRKVTPQSTFLKEPAPDDYYLSTIMKSVIAARKSYAGNYDGFIGVVSNFNYALNQDLGFDCSIEIIGPGEMFLEESAINNSAKCKDIENRGKSKNNLEHETNLHFNKGKEDSYIDKINAAKKTKALVRQIWELATRDADKDKSFIGGSVDGFLDMFNTARESREVYMSWAYFVSTFNSLLGKVKSEQAGTSAAAQSPGSKGSNPKLALNFIPISILPKFMSADPRICIFKLHNISKENGEARQKAIELPPPEPPVTTEGSAPEAQPDLPWYQDAWNAVKDAGNATYNWVTETGEMLATKGMQAIRSAAMSDLVSSVEEMYPKESLPTIFNAVFAKEQIDIFGDKLDKEAANEAVSKGLAGSPYYNIGFLNCIYINCAYIRDLLSSQEELIIEDVLSKILSDLNECSGGLWNLQYAVDEIDSSKLNIYDANYTSLDSRDPAKINPYNFKINDILPLSVVVETKLVDGFKEMVLYDTQTTDNGTTNNSNLGGKLYADKIKDGFKSPSKSVSQCTPNPDALKQILEDLEADLDAAYYLLVDTVDDDSVSGAKSALKQYLKFLDENPSESKKIPRNNNVLLPFNFSLDIDGFSGLVWGNAIDFDYLPDRYTGKVFFQVTKIKHSLNADQWITSLETVMRVANTESGGGERSTPTPSHKATSPDPKVTSATAIPGVTPTQNTNQSYVLRDKNVGGK
jgi:hypothetical protein